MGERIFLIWSNTHGAWWREGGKGYTDSIINAGFYQADEAEKICGLARDGWPLKGRPSEMPIDAEIALHAADQHIRSTLDLVAERIASLSEVEDTAP